MAWLLFVEAIPYGREARGVQLIWMEHQKINSYLVIEKMATIRVNAALNLAAVTLQLVERDTGVNVPVEVLHVKHLQQQNIWLTTKQEYANYDQRRLRYAKYTQIEKRTFNTGIS